MEEVKAEKKVAKRNAAAKKTTTKKASTTKKVATKTATKRTPKKRAVISAKGKLITDATTIQQMEECAERRAMFLEVFRKNMGVVTASCKKMGISRELYYKWRREFPEFDKKCDQIQNEETVDFAESALFRNIAEGDNSSIQFYLKSKGRHRGYGDKMEVTGADGKDLIPQITVQIVDAKEQAEKEE